MATAVVGRLPSIHQQHMDQSRCGDQQGLFEKFQESVDTK